MISHTVQSQHVWVRLCILNRANLATLTGLEQKSSWDWNWNLAKLQIGMVPSESGRVWKRYWVGNFVAPIWQPLSQPLSQDSRCSGSGAGSGSGSPGWLALRRAAKFGRKSAASCAMASLSLRPQSSQTALLPNESRLKWPSVREEDGLGARACSDSRMHSKRGLCAFGSAFLLPAVLLTLVLNEIAGESEQHNSFWPWM